MNKLPYGLAVLVTIVAVTVVQGRADLAASAVVLVAGATGAILGRRNSLLASSCFFLSLHVCQKAGTQCVSRKVGPIAEQLSCHIGLCFFFLAVCSFYACISSTKL